MSSNSSMPIQSPEATKTWTGLLENSGLRRLDAGSLFEAELADRHLAHLELLDLAGDGHGELVDRLPVAGNLEVGQALSTEGAEVVLAGDLALPERHPGHQLLAHARVGDADDLHGGHGGVLEQHLFDFTRVDVLAAPNDEVLGASDDVDV